MSTGAAPARPFEEEALFNAALLALLAHAAAADHAARSSGRAMPTALAYLIAPLALHGPTRRALPNNVTAQMGEWVRAHPDALIDLPSRARALRPLVSDGLLLGLRHGLLRAEDGSLGTAPLRRRPRGMARSVEVDGCLDKARFLGRWFSEQQDWMTAMAWWGLRP